MGVFRNLFSSDPALAVEHLFGIHNYDPRPTNLLPANNFRPLIDVNELAVQQKRLQANQSSPTINPAAFNGLVGHGPPAVRLAPATGVQPIPNATPGQAPPLAPLPNANPYQQFLQQLPNAPAPGLPTPPPDLRAVVPRVAQEQGIPPSILYGISGAESVLPGTTTWNNARGRVPGADPHGHGYFQMDDRYHPETAQFNPYNPYQAATQAAQQFKGNVNYFQSNPQAGMSPIEAAMRAYNAGRGGHLRAVTPSQDYNRFTQYAGANR